MKKIFALLLMLLAVGLFRLEAQVNQPVRWSFSCEKAGSHEYVLEFKAVLPSGWMIYSMYTPEGGPMPVALELEKDGVEAVGKPLEKEAQKKFDDVFGMEVRYFSGEYVLKQRVKITDPNMRSVKGVLEYQLCEDTQCMVFEQDFDIVLEEKGVLGTEAGADENLWWFFLFGVGYGLLAILMPCVFPMIPMTVSFFMHGDSSKARARSRALFFAVSIVAIFTGFGILVSLFLGPGFINWLSTNWVPNLFFFIIFMIFAASFFGAFEIVLPSRLVNKSDKQADRGGYIGAFFMAFTLVLVSFSCTVPFIGNLLVEASRGGVLRPVVGMLGFSVALALPFGFFAFFPSKLSRLPKSGGWLNNIKVFMGFVELALGMKFLIVIDQTYHLGILDREIYIAIWIVIAVLAGLYLMGKIRFKYDSELQHIGIVRLFFILATFTFAVYLLPGMFGAPLKALAGYLPPQESMDFDLNRIIRENVRELSPSGAAVALPDAANTQKQNLCETPKYADLLHLPHGIEGYFDFEQGLRCAKAQNKPIFLGFTGHGCANCREMEQVVWSDPRILKMLREEYVVIALYVDDKMKLPENEWYVSDYDGKWKKTLGRKNTDFQIRYFHSNAQPNYILLDSRLQGENMDSYLLQPPRGHNLNRDAFYEFLKKGVERNYGKK